MSQSFFVQLTNATQFPLVISFKATQNLGFPSQPNVTLSSGASQQFNLTNSGSQSNLGNSGVSVLIVNYAALNSTGPGSTATFTLHLDPKNTHEFNGSIYVAGFNPPAVSTTPAQPPNTTPPVLYTIYPYLILNTTPSGLPYASISLVQVVNPASPVFVPPPLGS